MDIFVEGWFHPKNEIGMELMNCNDFKFHKQYNSNIKYDWIINLSDIKDYPDHDKLIFGPSMMFPNIEEYKIPKNKKVIFNVLSPWLVSLCKDIHPAYNFVDLPFAVDTKRFCPSKKNGKPVLYFKRRDPNIVIEFINGIQFSDFIVFNYKQGYNELDYLKAISEAPFVVWVGTHESQGFAFQEALSCDCPIFVINVKSKREETSQGCLWHTYLPGHSLSATTASYFDQSCGVLCYPENWRSYWGTFINNLKSYSPRQFALNTFSPAACVKKWIEKLS